MSQLGCYGAMWLNQQDPKKTYIKNSCVDTIYKLGERDKDY